MGKESLTIAASFIVIVCFLVLPAQGNKLFNIGGIYYSSSGSYHIEETEDGLLFLITDRQWGWLVTGDHHFESGNTGLYHLDKTSKPPCIITDKNRSFYITSPEILNELTLPTQSQENDLIHHIKGNETLVSTKRSPADIYKSVDEARRGQKGEATLKWERRKAEEQVRLESERRAKQEAKAKAEAEARNRQELENLRKAAEQRQQANYEQCIQSCDSYKDICTSGCVVDGDGGGFCFGNCYYMEDKCKERCR